MDRRTIIFILSLTIAFFCIKIGFNYFETNDRSEWLKKQSQQQQLAKQEPQPSPITTQDEGGKTFTPSPSPSSSSSKKTQAYYLLENNYQQLVFSNQGAALVEINLPFQSPLNRKSVVLPIEFDRDLIQESPKNAQFPFPLHPAVTVSGQIKEPVLGGYYPLLRRDQFMNGKTVTIAPRYFGLNIISEYPEVAELIYEVKKFTPTQIVFEATQQHRRITKTFSLLENPDNAPYCMQLEVKIEGDSRGLWLTSGIPEVEWISGSSGAVIKYHVIRGNSSTVEKVELPKDIFNLTSITPDWICNSNGFFGVILDPLRGAEAGFRVEHVAGNLVPSRLHQIDLSSDRFPLKELPGYQVLVPLNTSNQTMQFRLFTGPFDGPILKQIDAYYAQEQGGRDSDYLASQTFHGVFSFISEPFAKFLFFLMRLFHSLFGSWALSIVLITCVLRLLLYPLNNWSMRSMKQMQLIAPELKAIQDRHKKDPQKSQQEVVKLYKEHGVNPLSGCLPLLIQMPFLIGMFDLLKSAYELRGACFIPGWIDDLSAPDVLFSWNFSIPLIGNEFHLLPFLLGGIMFVQQNMMSSLPKDPSLLTDQQRQQKMMGNVMTLVMTIMFYQFPSGLNIYWISSMVLGIIQQWWTNRSIDTKRSVDNDLPKKRQSLK